MRTPWEDSHRGALSKETKPAHILILDFYPPESWRKKVCLSPKKKDLTRSSISQAVPMPQHRRSLTLPRGVYTVSKTANTDLVYNRTCAQSSTSDVANPTGGRRGHWNPQWNQIKHIWISSHGWFTIPTTRMAAVWDVSALQFFAALPFKKLFSLSSTRS